MAAPNCTCHKSCPVCASSAMKLPSESPAKTRPPAVDSVPPLGLLKYLNSHFSTPVKGSRALSMPEGLSIGSGTSTLPMKSCPMRYDCAAPVKMSHSVEVATYSSFVPGLYDGENQLVSPIAPGQTWVPVRLGVAASFTMGLPSGSIPLAQVTRPYALAERNFPSV